MKFRNFLGVADTSQQAYYKSSVELIFPNQAKPIRLAILPAYRKDGGPTGWVPAVGGDGEESDFYTVVRAAKFVGHGNRRVKTAFLSPRTFDTKCDDPYDAFYDYCSRSEKWKYLTKDNRGRRITGEPDGPIFPPTRNLFVANVMDYDAGSRGGVFVTELSENVMRSILYSQDKGGETVYGIAMKRGKDGRLLYGDITNPKSALVIEIGMRDRKYVARPALDDKGYVLRTEIPETLLQHRLHMDDPESFLEKPESGQEIVDRLAKMLRGYKSPNGTDEIVALKEAMKATYGDGVYVVDDDSDSAACNSRGVTNVTDEKQDDDPFASAAEEVVDADPERKAEAVDEAVERAVESERYVPPKDPPKTKPRKTKVKPLSPEGPRVVPMTSDPPDDTPGEDIDPSDIAAVRAMLSGGK